MPEPRPNLSEQQAYQFSVLDHVWPLSSLKEEMEPPTYWLLINSIHWMAGIFAIGFILGGIAAKVLLG